MQLLVWFDSKENVGLTLSPYLGIAVIFFFQMHLEDDLGGKMLQGPKLLWTHGTRNESPTSQFIISTMRIFIYRVELTCVSGSTGIGIYRS